MKVSRRVRDGSHSANHADVLESNCNMIVCYPLIHLSSLVSFILHCGGNQESTGLRSIKISRLGRRRRSGCDSDKWQGEFLEWGDGGDLRCGQCDGCRSAGSGNLARHGGGSADVLFDQGTGQTDRSGGVDVDDVAQLGHVALHGSNGLDDPDLSRDLGGQVADQRKGGQAGGFGAGADNVLHQGDVVELSRQTGVAEAVAEELQLILRCRRPNNLHRH